MKNQEIVVLLTPSDKDKDATDTAFSYPSVQQAVKSSDKSICHMNVYQNDKVDSTSESASETQIQPSTAVSKVVSPEDLLDTLQSITATSVNTNDNTVNILSNNVVDIFEVQLHDLQNDDKNQKFFQDLSTLFHDRENARKLAFLAIDQPSLQAFAPKVVKETHRMLDTVDTTSPSSIYYKPEGAEYSIYYADTYLYITPDIFTGIMTSIFIAAVLYIGYSCLNEVQGASSFVMKPIPLGKEY